MQLIIHAGLHKSGTSSVQAAWAAGYSRCDGTWFPSFPHQIDNGHFSLFARHLGLFTRNDIRYLEFSRTRLIAGPSLAEILDEAESAEVGQLVLSSETLDQASARDLVALGRLFDEFETTLLLTITRPVHRFCATWQELVKHGATESPQNMLEDIVGNASLTPGRLQELVEAFPAARKVVRVVRTEPREELLAQQLAELLGFPPLSDGDAVPQLNLSLGRDTEILRALNRADATVGLLTTESIQAFRTVLEGPDTLRPQLPPAPATEFEIPALVVQAARAELAFLADANASGTIELVDPHDELERWECTEGPLWYRQIPERATASRADEPVANGRRSLAGRLWETRMRAAALEVNLVETTNYYRAAEAERQNLMNAIGALQSEIERLTATSAVRRPWFSRGRRQERQQR